MANRVLLGLAVLLASLATVVLARTVGVPEESATLSPVTRHGFDEQAVVQRLAEAVRIQTISYEDSTTGDHPAFDDFVSFLETAYPQVHASLERTRVGGNGHTLVYRWQGRDTTLAPALLMGHYDVVPVQPKSLSEWKYPPFKGVLADGYVWGRGTMDDKSGLLSTFEAVEYLLERGYQPNRTVYLEANHDEEIGGQHGAARAAERFEQQGIQFSFMVDEGMPVAEQLIQNVESPLAMVGVAEKGSLTLKLEIQRDGGHSSMPPEETAIGELATAIHNLKKNPMRGRMGDLLMASLEPISADMPFLYRMGLANLWLFRPLIQARLADIPHTNAALRTTVAPTIFRAGTKRNVLPTHAEAIVNFRIHPDDRVHEVMEHAKSTIDNPAITVTEMRGTREASFVSDLSSDSYAQLKESIWETFGEIPVAPTVFLAATDSRHFHDLTREIYRFRPIRARPSDRTRLHGTNERIGIENYREMVHFQIRLLKNTTSGSKSV